MLHHERLRPPSRDYPADEWNVIEKAFHPEFLAQLETMSALGNGYLGMRGCPEEGGPNAENGTFINGFYETRPIVYGEDAYGFARTGQTICNVTDSKIIKLFVDDEPFWLPDAHLLTYDRRLNMRSGTLDREILWETPAGKQVSIKSRRLVSLPNRHVAAISYCVTLLNAPAFVVLSSEMAADQSGVRGNEADPRLAGAFLGRVLHPRASYSKDRRIVLCHATRKEPLHPGMCDRQRAGDLLPALIQGRPQSLTSAKSPSPSRRSPAVQSSSPSTWSITPHRRLPPRSSAAVPNGHWIG